MLTPALLGLLPAGPSHADDEEHHPPAVSFEASPGEVRIAVAGQPLGSYVYQDPQITRPFLTAVHAPGSVQVTRNHPPVEGRDATDHATYHPGVWLAFGDLGGADFWRNRAAVRHVEFAEGPQGGAGSGGFRVRNRYEADGRAICDELCGIRVVVRPAGWLVVWDSEFASDEAAFHFGDQEEMGLGVRVATPLAVAAGGQIVNSDGLRDEAGAWGKPADWCVYRGTAEGRAAGVVLMPDPANFRRSWFHARDYGLLVANPFGRRALAGGEESRVEVPRGESLRLRFGLLLFAGDAPPDAAEVYEDFLGVIRGP